eukprot:775019-Prymnesium_polylepis.1
MEAEVKALLEDSEFARLRAGAVDEKSGAMDFVFDVSAVLSEKNAGRWKGSLKTDGVSARLLLSDMDGEKNEK